MTRDEQDQNMQNLARAIPKLFPGGAFFLVVQPRNLAWSSLSNLRVSDQVLWLRSMLVSLEAPHASHIWVDPLPVSLGRTLGVEKEDVRTVITLLRDQYGDAVQVQRVCSWLDAWLEALDKHPPVVDAEGKDTTHGD